MATGASGASSGTARTPTSTSAGATDPTGERRNRSGDDELATARHDARRSIAVLARVGFIARGLTALILAWLSFDIALGRRHHQASDSGAFELLAGHPWGVALLLAMAVGFGGFGIWLAVQAVGGSRRDRPGSSLAQRLFNAGRAVVYAFLCYLAVGLAVGAGHGSHGDPAPLAARTMQHPAGRALVAAAGGVLVIAGVVLIVRSLQRRFLDDLRSDVPGSTMRLITISGVVGNAARGFVVGLVGVFALLSGILHRAREAKGLDASLVDLARQPLGSAALIAVAVGFALFGVFCFIAARHAKT